MVAPWREGSKIGSRGKLGGYCCSVRETQWWTDLGWREKERVWPYVIGAVRKNLVKSWMWPVGESGKDAKVSIEATGKWKVWGRMEVPFPKRKKRTRFGVSKGMKMKNSN